MNVWIAFVLRVETGTACMMFSETVVACMLTVVGGEVSDARGD